MKRLPRIRSTGFTVSSMVLLAMVLTPPGTTSARASTREDFRVTTDSEPKAEIAGFVLRARFLPKGTIFFAHGWGADKQQMLDCYQNVPREWGWNAVFFDFRQHGQSSKSSPIGAALFSTLGYHEVWDFKAVVDWADRRGLAKPYVCLGASMGAAISLRYAAQDSRIRAVFAESPYRTGLDALRVFHVPESGPYRGMFEQVDLRRSAAQRPDLQIYVLAGERDWFAATEQQEIVDASPAPPSHKHFVLVRGGGHANFISTPEHARWLSHMLSANENRHRTIAIVTAATTAAVAGLALILIVKRRANARGRTSPASDAIAPD
jgi:pimeloyl-ACP methyl ester carboxylesterase